MTTLEEYGPIVRAAFALLHGGHPQEPLEVSAIAKGESVADFLARTRQEELGSLRRQLGGLAPPRQLGDAHAALLRLLQAAIDADNALQAQIQAYNRGALEESSRQGELVERLVAEAVRRDRELILALQGAEKSHSGTLAALGLADIVPPA